jgi:hypothetical protein
MSVSNEDGLPPALALDETPARLGASPESITRQVPDITYPALSSPGWHDAREASATTPLPSKALGAVAANAVMGRKHATAKLADASSFTNRFDRPIRKHT